MNRMKKWLSTLLLVGCSVAHAHGQPPSAADLDVGKDGSVRMHLQVPLVRILWRQQAPQSTLADFLTTYANLDDVSLNLAYQKLQDEFAMQAHLVANGSMRVAFQDWRWPPTSDLRSCLQELLPAALSEASFHEVIFPVMPIDAQAKAYRRVDRIELVLPPGADVTSPNILFPAPESPSAPKPGKRKTSGAKAKAPTSPGPR